MLRADQRDVPVIETVATSGAGVEALAAAIDARANGTATQKRANRLRRIRRLIAQSAGRRIRDHILTLDAPESDALVQAALKAAAASPMPQTSSCASSSDRSPRRPALASSLAQRF